MRIRTRDNESGEMINLSGMLDVLFILIIFFLVTTTFKEEEVDQQVNLPIDSRNQSLTQTAGNVAKINIRKNGAYVVLGNQVTEEELIDWLKNQLEKKPDLKVVIRCDRDSKHHYLANVMSICVFNGIPEAKISVRTETE